MRDVGLVKVREVELDIASELELYGVHIQKCLTSINGGVSEPRLYDILTEICLTSKS